VVDLRGPTCISLEAQIEVKGLSHKLIIVRFSSSHGGEYEAQKLLGCSAVFLIECRSTFKYIQEDSELQTDHCS
jgi:hypothetical protein